MADESGTGQKLPDVVQSQGPVSERLAELFDELGQRAEELADTAKHSAEVHEQMPAHLWSSPDHAERERMLADAEQAAAQAYRAHRVPPTEVRAAIIAAGEVSSAEAGSRLSRSEPEPGSPTPHPRS
jgi:hypothetical protein